MGKAFKGQTSQIDLMSPEQRSHLSSALSPEGYYSQFLQPQSQEDLWQGFQRGVVDPMMQHYQQQTVPGLQQRFVDMDAGGSSALNQALAGSAKDLQTSIAAQYLPYMQGQQRNTLEALGQMGNLAGQRTYQTMYEPGWGSGLMSGIGGLLGGMGTGAGMMLPWFLQSLFRSQPQTQGTAGQYGQAATGMAGRAVGGM